MKLEQYLKDNNGGWNGASAFVFIDEHRWKVAYVEDGETRLTPDGVRLFPDALDGAPADVVPSRKPKGRGQKVSPEIDLDDLEL